MKKIVSIIASVAALFSLASCDNKADFSTSPFVRLNGTSFVFNEDAGKVEIPIYAFPDDSLGFPRGTVSTDVTFEIIEGSAKNGVNFSVEQANGVVSIKDAKSGSIVLDITDLSGEFTGDLDFKVRLTSASNGLTLGGAYEASVLIKDLDHPLGAILGSYTADYVSYFDGTQYNHTLTIEPDPSDMTKVWINNLDPFFYSNGYKAPSSNRFYANVSADLSTMTVPMGQLVGYQDVELASGSGEPLVFEFSKDHSSFVSNDIIGVAAADGWYEAYLPGIVFSKN